MRRPRWQTEGREPDYRFTLANERTFLAWIRTALAVLAGGVLLHQFATHIQPRSLLIALSTGLGVLAAALAASAYYRWKANEIAIRHDRPLPFAIAVPVLAAGVVLASGALAVLLLR